MSANLVWYDLLAVVPYVALATWSLVVAGAFGMVVRAGGMSRHLLWGTLAFTLLAVFFFSLAVTGGSDPLIPRRQLAVPIRLLAMAFLAAGCGWIYLWSRAHIVIDWRHGRHHVRGVL